jgi:hypothetical protein
MKHPLIIGCGGLAKAFAGENVESGCPTLVAFFATGWGGDIDVTIWHELEKSKSPPCTANKRRDKGGATALIEFGKECAST